MAYKGENVLIRRKHGGSTLELASGALIDVLSGGNIDLVGADGIQVKSSGEISVKSGGSIDLLAGALFEIAGTDIRAELAAAVTAPVAGVAASYKLARNVVTPTATPQTIVAGLATVVAVVAQLQDAPTLTHMFVSVSIGDQAGSPAAGSFILVTQKPTATGDVTPIDATTPWGAVNWIAIGT